MTGFLMVQRDQQDHNVFGQFDVERAQQAAAVLFDVLGVRSMSRMKLLKLLYIADRESVRETGQTITGDTPVAMEWGPVLSQTYNCIKAEGPIAEGWNEHFHSPNNKTVVLALHPEGRKLSCYDIDKLKTVAQEYGHLTPAALSSLTHTFPEWRRNQPARGSVNAIPPRDLLVAVGRGNDADRILAESASYAAVNKLLLETS